MSTRFNKNTFSQLFNTYIIFIIGCIILTTANNIKWGGEHWRGIITSDGVGYYSYLPAAVIYDDWNFTYYSAIEKANPILLGSEFIVNVKGTTINKYYVGTAIAMTPFFLIGHWVTLCADEPVTGYSKYYHMFINVGGMFYLLLALYFIKKLLRLFQVKDSLISILLLVFTFGTNVFYYAVIEPSMSHIYSLFFIAAFLYCSKKWFMERSKSSIIWAAVILGMIAIIRPTNIIIVLALLFMAGSYKQLLSGLADIFKQTRIWIVAASLFLLVCFLQLIVYKIETGGFIAYSYTWEFFQWLNPQWINVLFSYKKGLFVYTPLILFSLSGLIYLFKTDKFSFLSILLFLITLTYLISSWWCWWYGGSFGQRAYIEFYPLFMILLAYSYKLVEHTKLKMYWMGILVLLTLFCILQTYQYRRNLIHYSEMNKEKYWAVFLRADLLL